MKSELEISPEWKTIPLADAVTLITGFPFKSKNYSTKKDDILLLRGDNIIQGKLRWNNAKHWPKEEAEQYSKYILSDEDVVLAMDRPWIEAGLKYASISKNDLPCLLVQRVSCLRAKKNNDQRFLKYVIGSKAFTDYVLSVQTGSAIPHISSKQIKEFKFQFPDLEIQKKIGYILSVLDKKIQSLQNQNKVFEQITQAIFKSWFIDFDGITEFENSELGKIPKGCKVVSLRDFAEINNGFAFQSNNYVKDGIFLLRTQDFVKTEYVVKNNVVYLPSNFYEKFKNFQLKQFDILLVMVGASIGSMGFVTSNIIPALQNQNMWNFRAKIHEHQLFLKHLVKKIVNENIKAVTGSARDFFRKDYFRTIKFVKPSNEKLLNFNYFVEPIYEKLDVNITQMHKLIQIRDSLLPKLMLGEIRV